MSPAGPGHLRVGVPPLLTRLPLNTSVQRIWSQVLPRLERHVRVVVRDPARRRWGRRVDVWLTDGHQGPLPVAEPVVAHFHEASWDLPEVRATSDPAFIELYRRPSEAAAAQAARIITVSDSSRDQIVAAYGVQPSVVHVAHNGVDLERYRPGLDGGADLVAAAGGRGDAPYVLFVGTVHPRKNLAALREAMATLAAQGLPHHLVVVAGPAPDRADSSELLERAVAPVAGRPVVNLAGIDDAALPRLMAGAAALSLPSLMEGFGMPVIEAMACGTPVVTADGGALPEVVADAGIVTAPTAEATADGLARVLGDPALAARLSAAGLERARSFGWDAMVERWVEALRAAAG